MLKIINEYLNTALTAQILAMQEKVERKKIEPQQIFKINGVVYIRYTKFSEKKFMLGCL